MNGEGGKAMRGDRSKRLIIIFSRRQKETHQEWKIKKNTFFYNLFSDAVSNSDRIPSRESIKYWCSETIILALAKYEGKRNFVELASAGQ